MNSNRNNLYRTTDGRSIITVNSNNQIKSQKSKQEFSKNELNTILKTEIEEIKEKYFYINEVKGKEKQILLLKEKLFNKEKQIKQYKDTSNTNNTIKEYKNDTLLSCMNKTSDNQNKFPKLNINEINNNTNTNNTIINNNNTNVNNISNLSNRNNLFSNTNSNNMNNNNNFNTMGNTKTNNTNKYNNNNNNPNSKLFNTQEDYKSLLSLMKDLQFYITNTNNTIGSLSNKYSNTHFSKYNSY